MKISSPLSDSRVLIFNFFLAKQQTYTQIVCNYGSRLFFCYTVKRSLTSIVQLIPRITKMPRDFKAPVNVSPLIRFGRWSFLLLGVTYGVTRHSYLQKKEDKTRETRHQKIAEREAKIAAEKKKAAEDEIKNLEVMFNTPKTVT